MVLNIFNLFTFLLKRIRKHVRREYVSDHKSEQKQITCENLRKCLL